MASWIAWHSARQIISTVCLFLLITCLLVDCDAQSLERGVRAPKNKFIRFGRAMGGQKFIRFGRSSDAPIDEEEIPAYELESPEENPLYLVRPFYNKRGGQKFIRFGRK